jgi:hypothetical protein
MRIIVVRGLGCSDVGTDKIWAEGWGKKSLISCSNALPMVPAIIRDVADGVATYKMVH